MNFEDDEYIDIQIPDEFDDFTRFLDNKYDYSYDEGHDTLLIMGGDKRIYTVECQYDDSNPYYTLYDGSGKPVVELDFAQNVIDYISNNIPPAGEEDPYEYDPVYGKSANEAVRVLKQNGYIVESSSFDGEWKLLDDNWQQIHTALKKSEILHNFTYFGEEYAENNINYYKLVLPVKNEFGLKYSDGENISIVWLEFALRFTDNGKTMTMFGCVANSGYTDIMKDGYEKAFSDNKKYARLVELDYDGNSIIQNVPDIVDALEDIAMNIEGDIGMDENAEYTEITEATGSRVIPQDIIDTAIDILTSEYMWSKNHTTAEDVIEFIDSEYDYGVKYDAFMKAYRETDGSEYDKVKAGIEAVFNEEENDIMRAEIGML